MIVNKWVYLDSLDSIRFSPHEFNKRNDDYLFNNMNEYRNTSYFSKLSAQSKIEIAMTILFGDGIVIQNNNFIDSYGFIKHFSNYIRALKSIHNSIKINQNIPFIFKMFNYDYFKPTYQNSKLNIDSNPLLLSIYLFSKNNPNEKGYYELSTWSDRYREHWASIIYNSYNKNDNELLMMLCKDEYFNDESQKKLMDDFRIILKFTSKYITIVKKAGRSSDFIQSSINDIINYDYENDLAIKSFYNQDAKFSNKIKTLVNLVKKIENEKRILNKNEAQSNTRDIVFSNENFSNLNLDELRGVLKIYRNIYNQAAAIYNCEANQNIESFYNHDNDSIWGFDEASFYLSGWSKYKNKNLILNKIKEENKNIYSTQIIEFNNKNIVNIDFGQNRNEEVNFWKRIILIRQNPEYRKILFEYIKIINEINGNDIEKNNVEVYRQKFIYAKNKLLNCLSKQLGELFIIDEMDLSNSKIIFDGIKIDLTDFISVNDLNLFLPENPFSSEEIYSNKNDIGEQ